MNRILAAAGGAAVLLVAALGVSYAQSAPTPKQQQHQAVISDAAAKLGLSADQLQQALTQARKDIGVNQGRARPLAQIRADELAIAAKTIGDADAKALRKELAGTTLTAVAQKHNVQPSTVSDAIKADLNAKIQAAVTAGTIKADRATKVQQKAADKVDALMTRQFPAPKS
jgi:hypothetical protein